MEAVGEEAVLECCDYVKADSIQGALDKLGGDAFDLAFGLMRYDSKKAEKFAFVMPKFLSMPVTVATRGDKTFKMSTRSDLADKKGVMFEKEDFGPLANGWISGRLDVERVPSMHEAFRRIMHGEADYMLSNYYVLHAFAVRWGVWSLLAFPHSQVFITPMYLALPKNSRCERWRGNIQRAVRVMKAEDRIMGMMQKKIRMWEKKHGRDVPPPELRPPEMMEKNASPLTPSGGGRDAGVSPLTGKNGAEKDAPAQEK